MIPDSQQPTPRAFTEAPIATLLAENLMDMSDEELDALQREIAQLVTAPGALTRALSDESASLVAKKPAARRTRSKAHDVSALI